MFSIDQIIAKLVMELEQQLLQDGVKGINAMLQDSEVKLDRCRSKLLSLVTTTTSKDRFTEFINKVRETRFIKVKNRQTNKFIRLVTKCGRERGGREISTQSVNSSNQSQSSSKTYNNQVISLSNTPLTPAQESLLAKGPNFAIASPKTPLR